MPFAATGPIEEDAAVAGSPTARETVARTRAAEDCAWTDETELRASPVKPREPSTVFPWTAPRLELASVPPPPAAAVNSRAAMAPKL